MLAVNLDILSLFITYELHKPFIKVTRLETVEDVLKSSYKVNELAENEKELKICISVRNIYRNEVFAVNKDEKEIIAFEVVNLVDSELNVISDVFNPVFDTLKLMFTDDIVNSVSKIPAIKIVAFLNTKDSFILYCDVIFDDEDTETLNKLSTNNGRFLPYVDLNEENLNSISKQVFELKILVSDVGGLQNDK